MYQKLTPNKDWTMTEMALLAVMGCRSLAEDFVYL